MVCERLLKSERLLKKIQFQTVFNTQEQLVSRYFVMRLKPNGESRAKLGISVGKKCIRLAVHRNQMKRFIRESFRHAKERLLGLDIVVVVRYGADRAIDGHQEALKALWDKVSNGSFVAIST